MGRKKQISATDSRGYLWQGEQRPGLRALTAVFSRVIDLDPQLLARDPESAWAAVLSGAEDRITVLARSRVVIRTGDASAPHLDLVWLGPPNRRWSRLVPGKGRSSGHEAYLAAHRIRALGVAALRPAGYLERVDGSARHPSFAAFEWIKAPTVLDAWRRTEGHRKRRALLLRVAEYVRKLHAAGVQHPSLSLSSILLAEEGLVLAEPEAVQSFRVDALGIQQNLASLARDAEGLTYGARMRFLHEYARHKADRRAFVRSLWRAVAPGAARVSRAGEKSSGTL